MEIQVEGSFFLQIKTYPLTKTNLQCLQRNDRAMIRQICSIKPEDVATVRSSELLAKLELEDLDLIFRERRLCWFGHVECSLLGISPAAAGPQRLHL